MLLPSASIVEARNIFAQLATNSPNRELWKTIYTRSKEEQLPDIALQLPMIYLSIPENLKRALGTTAPISLSIGDNIVTLQLVEPAEELISATNGLTEKVRHAIDVILRRAFDPFEALATWPLGTFFEEDEVDDILSLVCKDSEVVPASLEWNVDDGMDYQSYVCAIIKVTRNCNLRCGYCNDWKIGSDQTMKPVVLSRLFQRLLSGGDFGTVDVVWHGGEPTMLKQRGFLKILALQRHFLRSGQKLSNRLQTNATLIDTEWTHFLRRYHFRVGVSIDGPPQFHNQSRPDARGKPTFERVRQGLQLLRETNLLAHVYIVIDELLFEWGAKRLLDFLQEENITWVGVLAMRPNNIPSDVEPAYLDRKKYAQFLLDLYHIRQSQPTPWVTIRELDAALRATQGDTPGHCEFMGNCVGAFYSIDADGSVWHCDKYVGDSRYILGNVLEQDFKQIQQSASTQRLIEESKTSAKLRRESCPYFSLCHGWCPHERYIAEQYQSNDKRQCCGLDILFEALLGEVNDKYRQRQ